MVYHQVNINAIKKAPNGKYGLEQPMEFLFMMEQNLKIILFAMV